MDTETQTPEHIAEAQAGASPASNGSTSILDDLRSIRREALEGDERRLVVNVPGYAERLAVIYHYPPEGYTRAKKAFAIEADEKQPLAQMEGSADLLVACCAAVVGRSPEGQLVDPRTNEPLGPDEAPELPAEPMRFNSKLAEAFEIDVPSEIKAPSRFIVRALFSPRGHHTGVYDGDMALIATSNVVFRWLNGAEEKLEEDHSGE